MDGGRGHVGGHMTIWAVKSIKIIKWQKCEEPTDGREDKVRCKVTLHATSKKQKRKKKQ